MPVQVSLIDYYDPSQRQTIFYSIDEPDNDNDESEASGSRCSVDLTCDLFENAEAIVLGYPGEIEENVLEIKNPFPYKICRENFSRAFLVRAKLGESLNDECLEPVRRNKILFFLRYSDEGRMEIT